MSTSGAAATHHQNLHQKESLLKQQFDSDATPGSSFKMQFPVDLNSLFTMSYSFDALKTALEYLAK